MCRTLYVALMLIVCPMSLMALAPGETSANTPHHIADQIQRDSIISVQMPQGLYNRLKPIEPQVKSDESQAPSYGRMAGYRVQVFSGNNSNAKSEGQTRENQIHLFFPEHNTYLTYGAPYWRLRIGDFRTSEEAADFAAELKKAFPAFKREITVVRDRVTISQ